MLEADRLVDLHIEQLQRLFAEATDRVIQEAPRSEAMRRHKDTVADVAGDLVSVFETFRRRWLIAALHEDPKGFLANIEPNGRASSKERRAWEAVDQRPVRDVVEAVVDERGLDALLSAVRGDLCDDGGWLAPSQRSRLQRIDPRESARWRALKAARNCLEHRAVKTVQVLADALGQLDPESDSALMVRTPPSSAANVVRWLAAEVGAPSGHSSATRLHRSRLSHLYAMLVRVTKAMRSTPLDSSTAGDSPSNERS